MTSDDKLDEVSRKLDLVVRILAYQLVANSTLSQGAPILRRLGLGAREIAAIFNTTVGTVRVGLSQSKKSKKKKASK
jgi:DNA-directed RNA polymerase specialized sigma24 family protein